MKLTTSQLRLEADKAIDDIYSHNLEESITWLNKTELIETAYIVKLILTCQHLSERIKKLENQEEIKNEKELN